MAQEIKGLIAGIAAGLVVVGGAFGVSTLITHGEPPKRAAAPQSATQANTVATATVIAAGHGLYQQYCANCHGAQAQGQIGPTLHDLGDPDARIARKIENGFPNRMPAYKNKLSSSQIQALVAYIQSLNTR